MVYDRKVQGRYQERQRDRRGLVRLTVWVPAEAREKVMALADKLRKIAKKETPK